jgi:hypothetical protein
MKIVKKTVVATNATIFTLFNLPYVIVIESLSRGTSALNILNASDYMFGHYQYFAFFTFITTLLIYKLKKISLALFSVLGIVVSLYSLILFYQTFDKLVLMLSFAYCISYFYFYLMLKIEFGAAYYNSHFNAKSLNSYDRNELKISLSYKDNKKSFSLTNWASDGFFCRGESDYLTGKVDVDIVFKGVHFHDHGIVVASGSSGVGVKVTKATGDQELGWEHFYAIILELGLTPTA